jgi:uncharacterized protein (TIGR00255 family)
MTITPASMTGFARIEGSTDTLAWIWEVRCVNGKGLDVRVRAPNFVEGAEQIVRKAAGERFKRGSLQVSLNVERTTLASAGRIDHIALNALLADIAKIEIPPDAPVAPATLDGILQLRGIIVADEGSAADDGANTAPLADIPALLDALDTARREEGARLATVLRDILDRIESLAADAAELADRQPPALAERYRAALTALIADNAAVPEDRIIQEAAALAVKADVAEELERLKAHVAQARDLLASPEAAGRRLDFLAQEFNREANTLAAKSADIALTRVAMELKAAIDALKEQAQNIE